MLGEQDAAIQEVPGYGLCGYGLCEMKLVDEFREPGILVKVSQETRRLAGPKRHCRFIEVCGGHSGAPRA